MADIWDIASSEPEYIGFELQGEEPSSFREEESYEEASSQEFIPSYAQKEQVGAGGLGTKVGGKFTRLEKLIEVQSVSKETLYLEKLKAVLYQYFDSPQVKHYIAVIEQNDIPRIWLKNINAIAATIYMINSLAGEEVTAAVLKKYSNETGIPKPDMFRYYRFLKQYIKP